MPNSVEKQLETLPNLPRADLAKLWQKLFNSPPDPKVRRPTMIRFLAYRIQEQAHGSLSATSERRLRQLEGSAAGNSNLKTSSTRKIHSGKSSDQRSLTLHAGVTERYVGLVFGCAFLAPDIVEAILEGCQPRDLTFKKLCSSIPWSWAEQRRQFEFPQSRREA
jgi:Protein of unknown function (DUF2924)